MKVGYVVLYVNDAEACRRFWVEQIGMVEKRRDEAERFTIAQVGFADQPFAFELVPLELMKDNPDNLDLATPSIAFQVETSTPPVPSSSDAGCRRPRWASTTARRASRSRTPKDIGSRSRSDAPESRREIEDRAVALRAPGSSIPMGGYCDPVTARTCRARGTGSS